MTIADELAPLAPPLARKSLLPYKWELMLLLWFAYFINRADRQIWGVVLPQLKGDMHLSDWQLGLVAAIFTWSYGLLVPFGGYFGDLLRRKWVIVISLLLWSAATLLTGLSTGLAMLIILRGLATGAGESFYYPSATSLIGQFHHRTRALAMSIHQTALYAGVVISGLLVGYLAEVYGWRCAFYVFGIGGVLLSFTMLWRLKDTPQPVERDESGEELVRLPAMLVITHLVRKPTVWFLALAFAGAAFVDIGYVTWMPTLLQEKYGLSPAMAGFSSMFYHCVFALVGVLASGRLSDLWSKTRRHVRLEIQLLGLLCAAPFIYWMGMSHTRGTCYTALAIFGLFRGCYDSNLYPTLFEVIEPRLRSSAVGLMICFAFIVGAFAPLILGAVKGTIGLSAGLAALSVVYVFSGAMLWIALLWFFRKDCVEIA